MSKVLEPRWRRRKDERPSEILAAALDSFAERGFAATRLDDIAKRAGVTRGTLYLYFTSKEDLLKAVVRQAILPLLARSEELIARSSEPTPDLLRKLILAIPALITGSPFPAIPKLIIAEANNFPDLAEFYLAEVLGRVRRRIKALLRRGIRRGEFREVDLDHVFFCFVAPIFFAGLWRDVFGRFDKAAPDLDALCRTHAELLLRGLAPGDER